VHVALGQALIIYIYAHPYRAIKSAVVTVGKPNGGDPPARVGDTYETIYIPIQPNYIGDLPRVATYWRKDVSFHYR
jgi:hypothetical protein